MKTITLMAVVAFAAAYGAAVVMLVTGTLGLLGHENEALAAIFLRPLGLPWNLFLAGAPLTERAAVGAAAPMANLLLLWLLYRSTTGVGN